MEEIYTEIATLELEDGEYSITVEMDGGTGKASIQSPCTLTVKDQEGTATLEWSSSHYDYMLVNGEKYLPINQEGNSIFQIPVYVYDEPMEVVGDTTAMSTPHEIDYTLTFHSDEIKPLASSHSVSPLPYVGCGVVIAMVLLVVLLKKKGKGEKNEKNKEA